MRFSLSDSVHIALRSLSDSVSARLGVTHWGTLPHGCRGVRRPAAEVNAIKYYACCDVGKVCFCGWCETNSTFIYKCFNEWLRIRNSTLLESTLQVLLCNKFCNIFAICTLNMHNNILECMNMLKKWIYSQISVL